ncbi:hypothetical protein [Candidatus Phytoplasma sp. AldY-WA1]|uniref:hypothetical protein n=1 Tax=Candidatus Phytoplasma sp. AldY-WA1 TaxID=2852100 RepID=UPI00254FBBBA|nr:hypothetical protein [Candidatus Phytoplasma sp. AldY-WA1]
MNKEDISVSKHAQKMVHLINQNESLSSFEIKKITKELYHNLFYFKTTNYGTGAYFNSLNLHSFQLQSAMQENRSKILKKRKIMFIQHELKVLDLSLSTHDINKKIDFYHEIAKEIYNKRDKKEIFNFIKNKINENKDLQEKFNKEVSNSVEYFKKLNTDNIFLKKVYKNVCLHVKRNKENEIYPNPFFNIETKKEEIKRNIKISKNNARYKAINNFHEEKKISWLTLTLAHHNKNGLISKETKDLTTTTKLVKIFIKKLKNLYTNFLKKTNNKEAIKIKLKEFKYFIASQQQTGEKKKQNNKTKQPYNKKNKKPQKPSNVWHFHIMFNIDLLKIFDSTDVMICKNGLKPASEFLENDEYYKENKNKYQNQGWKRTTDKNLIIPNIFKLWADVVQEQLPQLKKLNPRAQNLQIFEEQRRIIKENGKKFIKQNKKIKFTRKI